MSELEEKQTEENPNYEQEQDDFKTDDKNESHGDTLNGSNKLPKAIETIPGNDHTHPMETKSDLVSSENIAPGKVPYREKEQSRDDKETSGKDQTKPSEQLDVNTVDSSVHNPDKDLDKIQPESKFRIELRFRLLKTAALVTTWICIGLFTEMSGPTFKDLELRLNLPPKQATEAVSRATSGRSAGFFVGAVIGGVLVDRFKRKGDLFIGLSLLCAAAVTVAVPMMSTLFTMWFLMFCQGTFEGIINVAGQEIILLLWGEKSPGPMHLLHFGFGMGSFLNPLIAQPFLGEQTNVTRNINNTFENQNVTYTERIVNSRIEYAFLVAAILTAVFSFTFFFYQFKGVPKGGYVADLAALEEKSEPTEKTCKQYIDIIDPATCADGKRLAGFGLFFLLFMYFFQAVGGERIYSKFIRNFALDQLGFSSSEATYLNSSFWISFSVGRFLGFIIAIWVPIKILILVECFSALGFSILLNIFGHNNKLALWVLTQPMALFLAPLFPSAVAWSDHYLKMSGVGIMILIAGGSLGGVLYIWILGYLYPNFGPRTFLYMLAAYGVAAAFFACVLSFAGYRHGDRFEKERMELNIPENDDKSEAITYTNDIKLETFE